MSIAHHHTGWLSLVEVSGPFLSLPVLMRTFPQGLDAHDPDLMAHARVAAAEWEQNRDSACPDPAIHRQWVRFVLTDVLGLPEEVITEGQAIPAGLAVTVAERHETLRPDLVVDYGAEGSADPVTNRGHVDAFLAPFPLALLDKAAAVAYGSIRADLARRGQLIGPNDLFIAAIAIAGKLTVVTHNTHEFSRVPASSSRIGRARRGADYLREA
jgi:hypothetical protein